MSLNKKIICYIFVLVNSSFAGAEEKNDESINFVDDSQLSTLVDKTLSGEVKKPLKIAYIIDSIDDLHSGAVVSAFRFLHELKRG